MTKIPQTGVMTMPKTKIAPELLDVWLLDPDKTVTKETHAVLMVTAEIVPLGIQVHMPHPRRWQFNPGRLIVTKAAYEKYGSKLFLLFTEHLKGNFRDKEPDVLRENQEGAKSGTAIYDMSEEPYIVTYCEDSCTMLLPDEY